MMKRRITIYLILFQCVLLGAIAINIYIKKTQVLGIAINPFMTENVVFNSSDELKHFYEPKPNVKDVQNLNWMGKDFDYEIEYNINSNGFNQLGSYSFPKPRNTFRIITLGSSFTFGQNVNTEDNYPSQLQNQLDNKCSEKTRFQVLNLGVQGYDLQYSVERLRTTGMKYNPDLILWLFTEADFLRFTEKLIPKAKELASIMKESGEYDALIAKGIYYPTWFKANKLILNEIGGSEKALILQESYIRDVSRYYKKDLVAVSLAGNMDPSYEETLGNFVRNRPNSYYYRIPIDLKSEKMVLPDNHPNKYGYRIIASELLSFLKNSKIIECK